MTTLPTNHSRYVLPAWGLSVCIHATVLAGALTFLHDLPRLEPPVYRMEFLLTDPKSVADTATAQEATRATEQASPAATSHPRATGASSPRLSEQHSLAEPSIIQRAVTPVTSAAVAQQQMSDSTPVSPASIEQADTPPPVTESPNAPAVNTTQAIERLHGEASSPTSEPIVENLQNDVAHSSPASETSESTTEAEEHSRPSQPAEQSSVAVSDTSSQTVDSSSSPSLSSDSPASSPQQTLVMSHLPITRTIPSRSDYGWLKDLLKRRIMSLQAYPRLARMQGWEGIVLVRATIKDDGSLLDAIVTESSGYESLDDDALKLMQRACPIRLPHDLGQSHIEVLIPVHYRLE